MIVFCRNCGKKVYQNGGLTVVLCEECKKDGYYLKDTKSNSKYLHYEVYKHEENPT